MAEIEGGERDFLTESQVRIPGIVKSVGEISVAALYESYGKVKEAFRIARGGRHVDEQF